MTKLLPFGHRVDRKDELKLNLAILLITRLLVVASSGGGKSYFLRKLLEVTYGHVQQFVFDMDGDFVTLRDKFDFVIVGPGGDVPADPRSAALLANNLLELKVSAIFNIFDLEPRDKLLFIANFFNAMIDAPKALRDHQVLAVLDEVHEFAPQKSASGDAEMRRIIRDCLNAVNRMASRGRGRGYCFVAASQRLSKVNKDTIADLRNTAIGLCARNIDRQAAAEELGFTKDERMRLRDLDAGEFFLLGPAFPEAKRDVVKAKIDPVVTRHPEPGQHIEAATPAPSSKVKAVLGKLANLPAVAAQEARDLQALTAKVRQLETELKAARATAPPPAKPDPEQRKKQDLALVTFASGKTLETCLSLAQVFRKELQKALDAEAGKFLEALKIEERAHVRAAAEKGAHIVSAPPRALGREPLHLGERVRGALRVAPPPRPDAPPVESGGRTFGKCERRILKFLAVRQGKAFSKVQIAAMAGYSQSGGFRNALANLAAAGLIVRNGGHIRVNDDVIDQVAGILGDEYLAPERDSLEAWLGELGKCERAIYSHLLLNPDQSFSKDELTQVTGYNESGGFRNALSKLKTLGLLERSHGGIRLNPEILNL
jgi:hypothetical protein